MIKLNNKNITYVALADTNNSLKAPKEIWYADSNNSVKLVYRRKDALIEGEDYEKYHWVKGDGSAYIDTLVSDLTNVKNIYCTIKKPDDVSEIYNQRVFGREHGGYSGTRFVVRPYDNHLELYTSTTAYTLSFTDNVDYINIDAESNSASTSQQSKTIEDIKKNGISFGLFADHILNSNFGTFYKGSIGEFTIDSSMHLIPCKLLKPVPKWLDANGIRRQVGECGMIDLVSGKFYGNVNSVGTFTVENYYERKEWLVGDGSAYIDTLINPSFGDELNATFTFSSKPTINNISLLVANDNVSVVGFVTGGDFPISGYPQLLIVNRPVATSGYIEWGSRSMGTTIKDEYYMYMKINNAQMPDIVVKTDGVICNYDSIVGNNSISGVPTTTYKVAKGYKEQTGLDTVKLRNVTISSNINLIPCTLTMDLPASMDANNIARTKGTSGMWDLVSDRFYGNVASSGTFKAVNLAEGVDYEVHQWLVAEIYPQTTLMSIPINSSNFSYIKENGNIYANLVHFATSGYVYYTQVAGMDVLSVWDKANGVFVMSKTVGSMMEFNSTSQGLSVNNTNITQYGFPVSRITFQTSSGTSNIVTTRTSSITVDGVEHYIPVKLLRSIPSKYDANGIARQAGECGMYDTVNDVFYGNVASSGSFTVEDDN